MRCSIRIVREADAGCAGGDSGDSSTDTIGITYIRMFLCLEV